MTYNQEKYIKQCLQSIAEQKTDFIFEIIVSDDCSTDNTPVIIKEFESQYPALVKGIFHAKNIGIGKNYCSAHNAAKGEYVAHCDGDDAWLPGKLAYQAKLLDENPDASQCWSCAELVNDNGEKIGIFPSRLARLLYPTIITARDIALSYALVGQHSTQMYRRKFKFNFDTAHPTLDFWIAFNIALQGPAIYSKKILGQYRMTSTSSMTRSSDRRRAAVDFLALHLSDIIKKHPTYEKEAKANMIAREFLSKIRGHDLKEIKAQLEKFHKIPGKITNIISSIYYFILQKI